MPDSYPFPIFSGLLEPKHYKQIGSALWLFLWCISSTTKDIEREGVTWGIVLGNKPVTTDELADQFDVNEKTVRRWIKDLEKNGYIRVTRAPNGLIFTVKNSKKWADKNVRFPDSDRTKMSEQSDRDRTEMSDPPDKNVRCNKDITEIYNVVVVDEGSHPESLTPEIVEERLRKLIKIFCNIHHKFDVQVNPKDIEIMKKVIALGVPLPLITEVMNRVYLEKNKDVSAFRYYEVPILKAWELEKSITAPVPSGSVDIGYSPKPAGIVSKQARKNEEAKRKIREAEQRERESSQETLSDHPEYLQ